MPDPNISASFNASIVALESTQNKIDKNETVNSTKYENATKIAHIYAVEI